jgi:hypothetical protein
MGISRPLVGRDASRPLAGRDASRTSSRIKSFPYSQRGSREGPANFFGTSRPLDGREDASWAGGTYFSNFIFLFLF